MVFVVETVATGVLVKQLNFSDFAQSRFTIYKHL